MSDEEKALEERDLAQEAYKRKEYDVSISHYSKAMKLNPKEMTFIYNIAKINLEKKSFTDSIRFCTKAIKVGKEQKASVKMVAKTMAMRGRAHKELGEVEKFNEDIDKAVKFLTTIANVKFGKERWGECIDFCQRAYEMGKENDFVDAEVLVLQSKATARLHADNEKKLGNEAYKKRDFTSAMKHYLKATELNPQEITFLNNIAAVKLEQEKYKECLEFCNKAIQIGEENGADSKKIGKALDRQARAQKLLDASLCQEKLERVKRGIQKANPHMDLRSLTVRFNPDTKELVASVEGLREIVSPITNRVEEWSLKEEQNCIGAFAEMLEDLHEGRVDQKTAMMPTVFHEDNFMRDITLYINANNLNPSNLDDMYNVSELLFEKGNYKGCVVMCQNYIKHTNIGSTKMNDRQGVGNIFRIQKV